MTIRRENSHEALSPGLVQGIYSINDGENTSSSFVMVAVLLEEVVVIVIIVMMASDGETQEKTVSVGSDDQEGPREGKHRGIGELSIPERMQF